MNARSAVVYSVLRLLAFLVPFGIMMLFPIMREYYWLAAIFAALIGLSLSILFLRRPLDEMSVGDPELEHQLAGRLCALRSRLDLHAGGRLAAAAAGGVVVRAHLPVVERPEQLSLFREFVAAAGDFGSGAGGRLRRAA